MLLILLSMCIGAAVAYYYPTQTSHIITLCKPYLLSIKKSIEKYIARLVINYTSNESLNAVSERTINTSEGVITGKCITISYKVDMQEYVAILPYNRRTARDTEYITITNGEETSLNLHPCISLLVSASDLNVDQIVRQSGDTREVISTK